MSNAIEKFKRLSFDKQVLGFCYVVREKVSVEVIIDWLERVKGSKLSSGEAEVVVAKYRQCVQENTWGNENVNKPKIEALGISWEEMNDFIADLLRNDLGL